MMFLGLMDEFSHDARFIQQVVAFAQLFYR